MTGEEPQQCTFRRRHHLAAMCLPMILWALLLLFTTTSTEAMRGVQNRHHQSPPEQEEPRRRTQIFGEFGNPGDEQDCGDSVNCGGVTANDCLSMVIRAQCSESCGLCGGGPPPGDQDVEGGLGLQESCGEYTDGFNLCLDLEDPRGYQPYMDLFVDAKDRMEDIIVGDLPNVNGIELRSACGNIPRNFDDLYLCALTESDDGVGGTLGYAQVLSRQVLSSGLRVSRAGNMVFDSADVEELLRTGTLIDVILHEMLHVIGVGTNWVNNGLYSNGAEYYDADTIAQANWNLMGCSGRLPVEQDGGPGTRYAHWDDRCLRRELMTGFLGSGSRLSNITIGSLADLGYEVNYDEADDFGLVNLGICREEYCPEAPNTERRLRGGERGGGARTRNDGSGELSAEGMVNVKQYAARKLGESRRSPYILPEGFEYGGDVITVWYKENDTIFEVTLDWWEVATVCGRSDLEC